LWTPDDLDKISANRVLKRMAEEYKTTKEDIASKDSWATKLENHDRFPYFHYKEYLKARGLKKLSNLVNWGPPSVINKENTKKIFQRTKSQINMMKLEILNESSDLSAIVESNEAHIRLLFGIWQITKSTVYFLYVGFILSLFGVLETCCQWFEFPKALIPYLPTLVFIILLILAIKISKNRIEFLFHYQRVRELTHILGCAAIVKNKIK